MRSYHGNRHDGYYNTHNGGIYTATKEATDAARRMIMEEAEKARAEKLKKEQDDIHKQSEPT